MLIRFDPLKVTQAAAFIIARHKGFITRKRLLKLLYITDRELIAETRRPLTGDRPTAMDHGPVLSHTYDLLKGAGTGIEIWSKYIEQVAAYTHRLVGEPGVGRLSRTELAKLEDVTQRYWFLDDDDLSELTHEFPEWERNQPPPKGVQWIPTEHVLEALGLQAEIEQLRSATAADSDLDALLSGAAR